MSKKIVLISFVLFVALAIGVINGKTIDFDNAFYSSFLNIKNVFFDYLFYTFTHIFDNIGFVILSIALIGYLYLRKMKDKAFFSAIVLFGGAAIGQILKWIFAIPRPNNIVDYLGYSFPSGHALKVTLFMFVMIYIFKDKIKDTLNRKLFVSLCYLVILIVCLSRVYIGAHWISDVIGGFLFAFGWFNLSVLISSHK